MKKLSTKEFIKKARTIHGNKYDYSRVNYKNTKDKIIIICSIHGEFEQSPTNHLSKNKCPKCAGGVKLDTKEFIKKAKEIHDNKYDYSKVEYIDSKTKIIIICPIHGEFEQSPTYHISQKQNCPKCANNIRNKNNKLSNKEFITKAKTVHDNKYDYSKVNYKSTHSKVTIICPKHGEFEQTPDNHKIQKRGCPKCWQGSSNKEQEIVSFIKSIYTEKIITNSKSIISPLELDIYIPEFNLAIEFNGLYWHSEEYLDKNYHLNKTNLCKEKDIRLIHIFEDEWKYKPNIVKARLVHALNICKYRVYARECEVYEIENEISKDFIESYHIQGNCSSSVKLGLYLGEELTAVMTFGKCRYSKNYEWELLRYCCLADYNVIGGAGKLLKAFERGWEPKSMVSYCDIRWGSGKLYEQLGFIHKHNSKPTYWYFLNYILIRESRIKYQKHKLHKILDNFDESLSETENMLNNRYLRIYDCGNMVFVKENN